jgi:phage terminase large subunit-like protein
VKQHGDVAAGGFDLRSLAVAVEASLLSESLVDFVQAAWPILEPQTDLRWGWALDAICQHLTAVTDGHITRLLMNVPPGCMKSLLTGVLWPAWEWTRPGFRSTRYLGTAHKQALAIRDNIKCRRLIQSPWYQARWPIELVKEADLKFENADTGFREAMSFSGMTGSRGDRVLLDDPLSVDGGNSDAELLAAERTFTESLPTRVNNEASAIVVIMQRVAEKDTSGIIIAKDLGYTHLMLPMRFDPKRRCKTSIGFVDPRKKDGELLFPERFPEREVRRLEKVLGEYAVAGQLQQRPTPRGGGMFKDKFLQLWPKGKKWPALHFVLQSYDTAFTDKTTNDPTACTVWGVWKNEKDKFNMLLLDAWSAHLNYAKARKRIVTDWSNRYGVDKGDTTSRGRKPDDVLVEDKGSGIGIIQELRSARVPVKSYNPGRADKTARGHQALPLYELGIVYVPEATSEPQAGVELHLRRYVEWARPFVNELTKFGPGADADDYVDTFTQATIFLRDAGWLDLEQADEDEDLEPQVYDKPHRNPYD